MVSLRHMSVCVSSFPVLFKIHSAVAGVAPTNLHDSGVVEFNEITEEKIPSTVFDITLELNYKFLSLELKNK